MLIWMTKHQKLTGRTTYITMTCVRTMTTRALAHGTTTTDTSTKTGDGRTIKSDLVLFTWANKVLIHRCAPHGCEGLDNLYKSEAASDLKHMFMYPLTRKQKHNNTREKHGIVKQTKNNRNHHIIGRQINNGRTSYNYERFHTWPVHFKQNNNMQGNRQSGTTPSCTVASAKPTTPTSAGVDIGSESTSAGGLERRHFTKQWNDPPITNISTK